jgi:hypothetical protein
MDNNSTHDFVEKIHDTQKKQEHNLKSHGQGNSGQKLPTKQHSTNK